MRYLCTNCSYIYDESLGDITEWYESWVLLSSMQDFFSCPVCGENIDFFQEINDEINYFSKNQDLSFEEEYHFPVLSFKDWKLEVSIWKDEAHPSEDSHFISSIALYDEYWDLVEEKFLGVEDKWNVLFDDHDLDDFEIRLRCNIHWLWSSWLINKLSLI